VLVHGENGGLERMARRSSGSSRKASTGGATVARRLNCAGGSRKEGFESEILGQNVRGASRGAVVATEARTDGSGAVRRGTSAIDEDNADFSWAGGHPAPPRRGRRKCYAEPRTPVASVGGVR